MIPPNQYWDSSVFVAFFSNENEPTRADIVENLLAEAKDGKLIIITSSFTFVEVLKLKGYKPITKKQEQEITDFFEYPFIRPIDATRDVCEKARQLIWQYPKLYPKDAVHIASALEFADHRVLDVLFSFDSDFTDLNGIITNKFPLVQPFVAQLPLGFSAQAGPAEQQISALEKYLDEGT